MEQQQNQKQLQNNMTPVFLTIGTVVIIALAEVLIYSPASLWYLLEKNTKEII